MNKRVFLSPPCMLGEERELLLDAFDSNWIAPLGPHVNGFEDEFSQKMDGLSCVALSSGTAAIHLALKLLGVKEGDEVITSSFTFVATANAIKYAGAKPVFIDSDWETWNMDPSLLREELTECKKKGKLPAAILTVDIVGQCCNYEAICEICKEFDVPLIEDAAESLGATYKEKPAGSFGSFACFSFNGNKIITTSGGGMLVCQNPEDADKARFLATQARDPAPHYEHSEIGYNYRMSNLLAAVGRGQLRRLDEHVTRRRNIFERYSLELNQLPGVKLMPEIDGGFSTRWLTLILVDPEKAGCNREQIRLALEKENIEARPAWKPMHLQPVFDGCRFRGGEVSEEFFNNGLCLPSGSSLTEEDQDRVIRCVKSQFLQIQNVS